VFRIFVDGKCCACVLLVSISASSPFYTLVYEIEMNRSSCCVVCLYYELNLVAELVRIMYMTCSSVPSTVATVLSYSVASLLESRRGLITSTVIVHSPPNFISSRMKNKTQENIEKRRRNKVKTLPTARN
jgi:hypothetical protein